jgi:hypothetical protein
METELTKHLSTTAAEINQEHFQAETALNRALEHARRAGELLIQVKGQLAHGGWIGWLNSNFQGSVRRAQGYMRIASRWGELEQMRNGVAHLPVRRALDLLSESGEASSESSPADGETSETEAGRDTDERVIDPKLAVLTKSFDLVFRRYTDVLGLMANVYRKAGRTLPAGYPTWEDYIDGEVITRVGLRLDGFPKRTLEEDVAIFKAFNDLANAQEVASRTWKAMGLKASVPEPRTGNAGPGLGLLGQLERLGVLQRTIEV